MDMEGDLVLRHDFGNSIGGDIWMTDHTGASPLRVFTMYGLGGFGVLAIGPDAGGNSQFTSTTAMGNIYIGRSVGSLTTNSLNNTFIGYSSGNVYTDLSGQNTFVGASSGGNITTGNGNTFIGESAGGDNISGISSGDFNTFIGLESSNGGISSGNQNVLIGAHTYLTATSGDMNICIGEGAHALNPGGTINNAVAIGTRCRVSADNFITLGFQVPITIPEQQVGIGYTAPAVVPPLPPGLGGLAKLYVTDYAGGGIAAFLNGDVYTSATFIPSDSALKENITPFVDASVILDQLEAKTYTFKQNDYPGLNLKSGTQIGFLAEDIEAVLPNLVNQFSSPPVYDANGSIQYSQVDFKGVDYTGLIPVLFTAIQQQQELLDSLIIVVSQCCTQPAIQDQGNRTSINLSNQASIILNQNTPNPFRDKTEISYVIPENIQEAFLLFYDQNGKIIQRFEISHMGQGSLTVYAEDLSSGIYTYSLIVDGENHQTKRMVRQ